MQHEVFSNLGSYEKGVTYEAFEEIELSNSYCNSMYGELHNYTQETHDRGNVVEENQNQSKNPFFSSIDEFSYFTKCSVTSSNEVSRAPLWYGENVSIETLFHEQDVTQNNNRLFSSSQEKESEIVIENENENENEENENEERMVPFPFSISSSPLVSRSPSPDPVGKKRKKNSVTSSSNKKSKNFEQVPSSPPQSSQPLSRKERNRIAAQNYRKKLRDESDSIAIKCEELFKENAELKGKIEAIRAKNKEYQEFLSSLQKK